ncbi:hypothetical protein ACFQI7_32110 [Paenibacillus allorhizosphaerae]|uniref:Tetratricopeptide repeat protein n=1 Tax=Paenibacillus allorhizosphaerae TaxID=2849866 RepID=A0ABN7TSI0_9BACL|nr:hypothetical protein [Paenibacillus allorhizosphaerae]CAG7654007.1 hypothetical protein PAECIP111802_05649 [Paenibacillus allorhizosphaerae]
MSTYKIVDLKCPGCGEPSSTSEQTCKYCGRQVIITSFNSVYEMLPQDVNKYVNSYKEVLRDHPEESSIHTSIGMCYLRLRLHEKALESFEKATQYNFDNSETYFYAAVCLLKGKKAYLAPKAIIEKAQEYLNAALTIENRGIYHYFLAYIKYDFYERKFLRITPNYESELKNACVNNVTKEDIRKLFDLLNVDIPNVLNVE